MILVRAAPGAQPEMEGLIAAGRRIWVGGADFPVLRFTHTREAAHISPTTQTQAAQLHATAARTRPYAAGRAATFGITVERAAIRGDGLPEPGTTRPYLLTPCSGAQWQGAAGGVCGTFSQALSRTRVEVWSWPGGDDRGRQAGARPPPMAQDAARHGDVAIRNAAGEAPASGEPVRERGSGGLSTWSVLARPGQSMCFGVAAGGSVVVTGTGERHTVIATQPLWIRLVIPRGAELRAASAGLSEEVLVRVEHADGNPWTAGPAPRAPLPATTAPFGHQPPREPQGSVDPPPGAEAP